MENEIITRGAHNNDSRRNYSFVLARLGAAEDRQGLRRRVAREQGHQSGERNNGKGLRRPMPHGRSRRAVACCKAGTYFFCGYSLRNEDRKGLSR
jgi:hypothetical protein